MAGTKVSDVYAATSVEQQEKNYDEWATEYEKDLCAMGYRMPMMIASVFVRFVEAGTGPILDVGCGGGIQAEPLHALGYTPLVGMDLSQGMLNFAAEKNLYDELVRAKLGDPLEFPDNHFSAILSSGTFTSGHAPAESFRELVRIAHLHNQEAMDGIKLRSAVLLAYATRFCEFARITRHPF